MVLTEVWNPSQETLDELQRMRQATKDRRERLEWAVRKYVDAYGLPKYSASSRPIEGTLSKEFGLCAQEADTARRLILDRVRDELAA